VKPGPTTTGAGIPQQGFLVNGGVSVNGSVKPLPGLRSAPAGQQRTVLSGTVNTGSTAVRPQAGMVNAGQKVVTKPVLPPTPPVNQQRPNATLPTSVNGLPISINGTSDNTPIRETAHPTPQPLVRSIAGPIKAGMPNFGHFSANAFLAKKFPGLMPGASRPIVSPGQLPYTSKAAAGVNGQQAFMNGQHEVPGSPSGSFGKAPKRPTKKRKTKNGGGVASAEAENDLNVMDGFGYLYGYQDTSSAEPGLGKQGTHAYHGPVGWAPGREAGQLPGSSRERQVSENRHGNVGAQGEAMRAEEYVSDSSCDVA
jgi:hypothetical protein